MALTVAQKEANRLVKNARQRAFSARRRERDAVEEVEKAKIGAKFNPLIEAMQVEEERIDGDRKAALAAIDEQIADLQRRRTETAAEYHKMWDDARRPGCVACDQRNDAERELDACLDVRFPDLAGHARWSVVAWENRRETLNMEKCW